MADKDLQGLSQKEASQLLLKFGSNTVATQTKTNIGIFLKQFRFPFTYILFAAMAASFLLKQFSDAYMIVAFIFVNVFTGFYMEARSNRTVELLKSKLAPKAKALRDGVWGLIDTALLVPGDVVEITAGNIIPADIDLFEVEGLGVDESTITGESQMQYKKTKALAGTVVVEGSALGKVVATGKNSTLGKIAKLIGETERVSTFEQRIAKFSRAIVWLVAGALLIMVFGNIFLAGSTSRIWEFALFSIALAVSVIPEALPLVITYSFAQGALKLAKEKVLVKRLSAIEDMGSIEILCTDKTGTLTENSLAIAEVMDVSGAKTLKLDALAGFTDDTKSSYFNSFDSALFASLTDEQKKSLKSNEIIKNVPFNADKRYVLNLVKRGTKYHIVLRGAPEAIVGLVKDGSIKKREVEKWVIERGHEGKRVLAVCKKQISKPDFSDKDLSSFEFVGMVAFVDPVKLTSKEAVESAERLGLTLKILTGDRREVSSFVAKSLGLIKSDGEVMMGDEFARLSLKNKKEAVDRITVFARILPQQKYEIVKLLQEKYTVGFMGDGVNDAPALKLANVAMVVSGANDVARDAADIVFLKKDLKLIIDGINKGRIIFTNTTKYITATLSANFGNFFAIATASFLIKYLPMLPSQILLVNLLSDFPMIAMATDNADIADLKKPNEDNMKRTLSLAGVLGVVSSAFDFIFFTVFLPFGERILQTGWFIESILTELIFIFSARTKLSFFKAVKPSLALFSLVSIAAILTIIFPFTKFGQTNFEFIRLDSARVGTILLIVLVYFVTTETAKLLFFRFQKD